MSVIHLTQILVNFFLYFVTAYRLNCAAFWKEQSSPLNQIVGNGEFHPIQIIQLLIS